MNHRNGKAFRQTVWIVVGGFVLAFFAWFGQSAAGEVADVLRVRDDLRRVEKRVELLETQAFLSGRLLEALNREQQARLDRERRERER